VSALVVPFEDEVEVELEVELVVELVVDCVALVFDADVAAQVLDAAVVLVVAVVALVPLRFVLVWVPLAVVVVAVAAWVAITPPRPTSAATLAPATVRRARRAGWTRFLRGVPFGIARSFVRGDLGVRAEPHRADGR
jgi:energy-coupling factor transporter transmembrane protein EcfT